MHSYTSIILFFLIKQYIARNFQLNLDLLYQLTKILYDFNLFINIYKIATEKLESIITNIIKMVCIILNLQIKLLLKLEADYQ